LTCFLLFRLFAAVVGVDSFIIKLSQLQDSFKSPHECLNEGTLVFLLQILGCVDVLTVIQKRLDCFCFGYEDSHLSAQEEVVMKTWRAMIVQKMWDTYSFPKFCSVMITYSHADFQKLVLEDVKIHKESQGIAQETAQSCNDPSADVPWSSGLMPGESAAGDSVEAIAEETPRRRRRFRAVRSRIMSSRALMCFRSMHVAS